MCPHFRRYDAEFTTSRATKRSAQPQIQAYKKENQPRFSLYKKELFSYPTPWNPLEPPWSLFMLGWLQKPWLFVVNRNHPLSMAYPFCSCARRQNVECSHPMDLSHDILLWRYLGYIEINWGQTMANCDR